MWRPFVSPVRLDTYRQIVSSVSPGLNLLERSALYELIHTQPKVHDALITTGPDLALTIIRQSPRGSE